MTLLGRNGILELRREWPPPMILSPDAIDTSASKIFIGNDGYWTGDRVIIAVAGGLPIDVDGDGYADNPDGHGIYFGSRYELGPERVHLTSNSSSFYGAADELFYTSIASVGLTETYDAYISLSDSGRAKLYTTELAAYNETEEDSVEFRNVKINNMIIAPYPYNNENINYSEYVNTIKAIAHQLKHQVLEESSQELSCFISIPSEITSLYNDSTLQVWRTQCDLTEWALNIDATTIDTMAIGEVFGDKVKSTVSGSGTCQFFVNNSNKSMGINGERYQPSVGMLRLVMLTRQGSKAKGKFYLYRNGSASNTQPGQGLYHECNILFNRSTLDTRAGELITGSVDFVTTGEIALRLE